jgi:hypothetical protein
MTDAADGRGYRADVEHFRWPVRMPAGIKPRPHRRQRLRPTDCLVLDVDAVTGTVVGRVERHLLGEVGDTIERLTRDEITESGCNPGGTRAGGLALVHSHQDFAVVGLSNGTEHPRSWLICDLSRALAPRAPLPAYGGPYERVG